MKASSGPPDASRRLPPRVEALVEAIRERYQPQRIVLFGSYAWSTPREDSDVDLLIVKDTDEPAWKRAGQVRRLVREERRGMAMDILVYTQAEVERRLAEGDPFLSLVLRRGTTLYAS